MRNAVKRVVVVCLVLALPAAAASIALTLIESPTAQTDLELLEINKWYAVPNPGGQVLLFHVAAPNGIDDLHISVPAGQVEAITVTQNLFPNQVQVDPLSVNMDGRHLPFCTFFTVTADVSFNIKPTPEPASMILLALGSLWSLRRRLG